jgi:hypothetical protein
LTISVILIRGKACLLCSDGLYNQVPEKDILALVSTDERADQKVMSLICVANPMAAATTKASPIGRALAMIEIGEKIDERYRVTSRIAHGGMADVYEAYDIVNRRSVALKVMRVDMMDNPKNIERFNRECIAAASLNNPNIVKVYGQGVVDGRPYMANEYVDGRTLRDKLNVVSGHNLPPLEACEVMLQLTSGVQYIHEHGSSIATSNPTIFSISRWLGQDRRFRHLEPAQRTAEATR